MAEEFDSSLVNVRPYQFEPIAAESDGETSDESSDSQHGYDVNKDRIGQVDW